MNNIHSITTDTQFCAVIGNPVAHSLSPAIHNAAFEALDLDFVYVASRVEDVRGVLAGVRALSNFRGLSVTIPHKVEAMKYVDEVAEVDRSIGAINTVIHEGDRLIGLGTDGPAALKALSDARVTVDGKNILILGSGGAARSICFTLARTVDVQALMILDVNAEMMQRLSVDLIAGDTGPAVHWELLTAHSLAGAMARADIIIHCTPIGMHPKEGDSLIPPELLRPGQTVFDIVYTPLETRLLADARAHGCTVIPGVEMFINQAALQFEHFTGVVAPVDVMRQVVMEHLQS